MYSLLVSHLVAEQNVGELPLDASRYLEYTDEALSLQLRGLSTDAVASIVTWPCLVMDEGRGNEPAFLREIVSVRRVGRNVAFTLKKPPDPLTLSNDEIWRLRTALDIGEFEFSRNHFAVKDQDLFAVLAGAGSNISDELRRTFRQRPLPAPPRSILISARDVIGNLGHTEIDDILLEIGIDDLRADRSVGSRRDRANAIIKYCFDHPEATTAENSLLGPFLVKTAGLVPEASEREEPPASSSSVVSSIGTPTVPTASPPQQRSPNRVFIVHGRDEAARKNVTDFLQSVGLVGIVLHEQPNMGRHLLTKFIDEAELVTFAIILMTGDDIGGLAGSSDSRPRARQNVVLELGYFLAHLGQARVCALVAPNLETPSDFDGIVYIGMSADGHWKTILLRELEAAEMPVTRMLS